ncbi:hypothetical protein RF11_07212 [Thelohanellus kitauei]|uniref:Uncharacterized protein n=1 Tax=Thelohanellus kitauei TaxID=669202 RepID=A0A0C2MH27_THEKT|nr:hypothetical protein RF11_07212 [Thelohanellus kitauei]
MSFFFAFLVSIVHGQKQINVDEDQINVLMVGNIGLSYYQSAIKREVAETITKVHESQPFQLGINPGNNVYDQGVAVNDFDKLDDVFRISFPMIIFDFDFLSVPGDVDHKGDINTLINYHRLRNSRFYMPSTNYYYDNAVFRQFDHVFLVMHHKVVDECGPHTEIPNDEAFLKLISHDYLTGILTSQNTHFQEKTGVHLFALTLDGAHLLLMVDSDNSSFQRTQ